MNIVIDARLIHETGVGRYIRNLIGKLASIDTHNRYTVILMACDYDWFELPNTRWEKRKTTVHWHTVSEQILMPWILWKARPDLVHIPYFNVPILYPGKFVTTIHDLTILHVHTGKASTLPYWKYVLRKIGYRLILWIAIQRAAKVITVSHTVKKDILLNFRIADDKVAVTYEGIDDSFMQGSIYDKIPRPVHDKYFLYVGNVYPHKNVETLLEAFRLLTVKHMSGVKLLFVGPKDYFYTRLATLVTSLSMSDTVEIRHAVSDEELGSLYHHAEALIFPSRMEGFGLPALEALSYGCPVIASDIPVFHEILGTYAYFTDTTKPEALSRTMNEVLHGTPHKGMEKKPPVSFLRKFSWDTMARMTLQIYQSSK